MAKGLELRYCKKYQSFCRLLELYIHASVRVAMVGLSEIAAEKYFIEIEQRYARYRFDHGIRSFLGSIADK